MDVKIQVRGLRELRNALTKVDAESKDRLKAAFRHIAEHVVSSAQGKVPRRTGAAAGSIKPRSTTTGAGLAFGGTAAPYFPWLDFGGRVGRQKHTTRPFIKTGRYIYPTIKEMSPEIIKLTDEAMKDAISSAGFEQDGSN